MDLDIMRAFGMAQQQAIDEVLECNAYTARFGLSLTREQAGELVETRSRALSSNGRVEFGGGVVDKIIKAFCDSPYISMHNYADTIHDLVEIFYYYKNESLDMASDDELIDFMRKAFDGVCQGSIGLLAGRELNRFAHDLRYGRGIEATQPDEEEYED